MKKTLIYKNLALLLINLIPLYGVIFLGWQAMIIILFYVAETIMVGVVHVCKLLVLYIMNHKNPVALAVKRDNKGIKGLKIIPFFIFHFGFFVFVQMMVFGGFTNQNLFQSMGLLFVGDYKIALIAMFVTKLTLLITELFWDSAVEFKLPDDVFFEPYPRIFVQQFMVILGGWFTIIGKGVLGYLVILVICKTILDILIANANKDWFKKMTDSNKPKAY